MNTDMASSRKEGRSGRLRAIAIGALTAMVLASLYVGLQPSREELSTAGSERVFRVLVPAYADGSELPVFKVKQGDRVTFRIRSAVTGEANIHGYEKKITLQPEREVTLSFIADNLGMYPLHLHQIADEALARKEVLHRHLAALEVHPR